MARNLPDPLFSEYDLFGTLQNQDAVIGEAVEEYPAARFAEQSDEQLVDHFTEQFRISAPVLTDGATSVAADEAQVDVSGSFDRDTMGQSPYYVPGMRVTYYVPFSGDSNLFKFSPSQRSFNPPRAEVVGQELQFVYERPDADVAATRKDFDAELQKVRQYLGWMSSDAAMFNSVLPSKIRGKVSERRARLQRASAGLQELGLPVRKEARADKPVSKTQSPASAARSTPGQTTSATYDVALSFAGENRAYVEAVAQVLRDKGVSVFYDGFEKATLWGKNLVDHLADIYQHRSRFVVMFISKHYVEKAFPTHERQHAQARALVAKEEYILPARFDDTEVPGLPPTVAYADLRKMSPQDLADLILAKLGRK